jgi:hypothetical protein
MAYSNYGGKVTVDNEDRPQNCDVTPQLLLDEKVYKHYMLHFTKSKEERNNPLNSMYHAIGGDKNSGILVCLYKEDISQIIISTKYGPEFIVVRDLPEFQQFMKTDTYISGDKKGDKYMYIPWWDLDFDNFEFTLFSHDKEIKLYLTTSFDNPRVSVKFKDIIDRNWYCASGYAWGSGY